GRRAGTFVRAMPEKVYVHKRDNYFQHIEVLKTNRKKRTQYNEFYTEGVKVVDAMLAHDWEVTGIYYQEEQPLSDWAKNHIQQCKAPHYILTPELLAELSEKEETSELLFTAKMKEDRLERIPVHDKMLLVVFDRPASPGNLGSSLRSCDAFGVDGVIITGHAADIYDPFAIRGSMGTLFTQNVIREQSSTTLVNWISELRSDFPKLKVLGTSAKADISLVDFKSGPQPIILLVGNETYGLSKGLKELSDEMLSIPMGGWASSLNVSCALSVALYQIRSTRS
ncbi:MAG: hypothetical protein KDD62_02355, partial [Bdellovibrionales bacterium]|nr:hypothetical protein [Bdellovibrionales bacterium]